MPINSMRAISLAAMTSAILLTGCNMFGPGKSDIGHALGIPAEYISDLSCSAAEGNPGYNCSYVVNVPKTGEGLLGMAMKRNETTRFVKSDDGSWRMAGW